MTDRTIARVVGLLFILATATAIVGGLLVESVDDAEAVLAGDVAAAGVITGVLLELVLVISVIGIAAVIFPVLRRRNEGGGLAYLGLRITEGVLLLAAAVSGLLVFTSATELQGSADAALVGDMMRMARDWTYLMGSMVMLGLGALVLYTLLYRSRLVPVWLSLWGLAGGALILARGVAEMYGAEFATAAQGVLAAPIALNEMVLAVWLIVRGFHVPAVAELPEREPALS